jgi:hypothetical protein
MRKAGLIGLLSVLIVGLWAPRITSGRASINGTPEPRPITVENCPVTIPNNQPPPNRENEQSWHHEGPLWVGLPPDGVMLIGSGQINDDGSMWNKMIWVRESVAAPLYVRGVLLSDPRVKAEFGIAPIADQRYIALVAMGVVFPEAGCWAITGSFGYDEVTVVVWVMPEIDALASPTP